MFRRRVKDILIGGVVAVAVLAGSLVAWAAYPSNSARTKTWGAEVLTAADLHTQFDIIHTWLNAAFNSTTGHTHDGTANQGPKINAITGLKVTSQAQGDLLYASSSSAFARLGAGTSGQFLKTQGTGANPVWADVTSVYVPRSSWRNLSVTRTNATTVAVTADELVFQDSSNISVRDTSISVSAAITTSGANGLDTGVEAANTIYYVWVIRKSSDGTKGGLLSTSSTSPTMPSGYDQKALVSAVGNNNSSDFIDFKQTGKRYTFTSWATLASGNVGTSPWVSIDLTPANMSTVAGFVPSALSNFCYGTYSGASAAAAITNDSSITADATSLHRNKQRTGGNSELDKWEFDVLTTDTIYWVSADAGAIVFLQGFEINKLE